MASIFGMAVSAISGSSEKTTRSTPHVLIALHQLGILTLG